MALKGAQPDPRVGGVITHASRGGRLGAAYPAMNFR